MIGIGAQQIRLNQSGILSLTGTTLYVNGTPVQGAGGSSGPIVTGVNFSGLQSLLVSSAVLNWTAATSFYTGLTNNIVFTFTGQGNSMSIDLTVKNTGAWTAAFPSGTTGIIPGTTGIAWPFGVVPVQSTGSLVTPRTDFYSFSQINNTVYGSVIQGY